LSGSVKLTPYALILAGGLFCGAASADTDTGDLFRLGQEYYANSRYEPEDLMEYYHAPPIFSAAAGSGPAHRPAHYGYTANFV